MYSPLQNTVHEPAIPLGSSLALSMKPVDWLGSAGISSASMSKSWGFSSKSAGGLAKGCSWSLLKDCGQHDGMEV